MRDICSTGETEDRETGIYLMLAEKRTNLIFGISR